MTAFNFKYDGLKGIVIETIVAGLILGLSIGLISGIIGGLNESKLENKNLPNQAIWNSWENGLLSGLIVGLSAGVIPTSTYLLVRWLIDLYSDNSTITVDLLLGSFLIIVIPFWLIGSLISSLRFGVKSAVQHFALRIVLYWSGNIPWNYALFLDHAAKHRFIQRVGGRYRFMHDLLRKHFAQMPLR